MQPAVQRQNGGRGMLSRAVAVASALLMVLAVGMVVLQDDAGTRRGKVAGSGGVELSEAANFQQLWESGESVNHDPYYNIFEDGSAPMGNYGQAHKTWNNQVVRERVWQTLNDVKAMERHVREQNALNNKMKMQITTLEQEAQNEKEVIRKLIASGMSDVTNKISLLKNAAMSNVSDVREMLVRIEAEQKAKQVQQDTAIHQLTARHQQLQTETTTKFQQVDSQISAAEKRLAEAKTRVASEREEVKKLIMEKIKTDVGGLDKQMTDRLENEKFDIRTTIDGGLKQLDGNISDYSLATGIRVARLMNKVAVLKKDQKDKSTAQDKDIASLENDHKELKAQTLTTLGTLRTEVDDTKKKLSQAQQTLEAEQALRQTAEEAALSKDTAKLHSATEQSLADAKDTVSLKIGDSNAWAHTTFTATKGAFHHSVDDLERQLGEFVKVTKAASAGQEQALQLAKAKQAKQLSGIKQQTAAEEQQVTQTETAVALANAKLKGEVVAQTKELRLKLLQRMTALQSSMSTSLAQVRTELQGNMQTDQTTLSLDLSSAKATTTGVIDSVNAQLQQTQTQAKKSGDESKTQLADVTTSEKALADSTGSEMTALGAEMKAMEDSMLDARTTLTAEAGRIQTQLRDKLDVALKGLNVSVGAAMLHSRADVEAKMTGDMAELSKQIGTANAASLASADTLHAKAATVEAAAKAAGAASKAQVVAVAKDHTAFEAKASLTLAHVQDSLLHTKAALSAADKSMQAMLAQRESALKTKVEGQMKAVAKETVDKVDQEASTVQQAHEALQQAITAHRVASEASVAERKSKLEKLATDLQTLQAKMKALGAMSSAKTKLLTPAVQRGTAASPSKLAAARTSSVGTQVKHTNTVSKNTPKQAHSKLHRAKAATAHAKPRAASNDVAARKPQAMRMRGDEKARGEDGSVVHTPYYTQSLPAAKSKPAPKLAK